MRERTRKWTEEPKPEVPNAASLLVLWALHCGKLRGPELGGRPWQVFQDLKSPEPQSQHKAAWESDRTAARKPWNLPGGSEEPRGWDTGAKGPGVQAVSLLLIRL